MAYLDSDEETELIFLYYIDTDGNLLWRQGYASRDAYPHIRSTAGDEIHKYGDNYLIHGHCYYPYPSDTTHFYQRPCLYNWIASLMNNGSSFWGERFIGRNALETTLLNDSTYFGTGMLRLEDL